jgi:hypothetical protein
MIKFVSIILSILLVGCISTPTYQIDDMTDIIDGRGSIQLIENHIPLLIGADVEFNAEKFIARDGNVYYNIVLRVVSYNRLFIEEGESLVIFADGTRIGFSGDGSANDRETRDDGAVEETAFYDVTPEQLNLIANAKDVRIEIKGAEFSFKRKFIPENFTNLKRFIAEYVDR